ncbi:CMRF35-like molecule 6 [Salmo salar]|uniref:CMRF35-like molecule 6 n=1 Tax=Salmo salar TaxID=8030 RepID=E7C174_SALSA|nr:CMRF35-like molecule 6 [Salmo salar]ADV31324.1 NILT1 [Salmo salar]
MVILLVPTLKIVLLLAAVWSVCTAELITVEGYEGGKAEIRCPYREEWRSHHKYLCKGDCSLYYKDKVIKTEAGVNSTSRGRYSLKDIREESVFLVTITDLTLDDAGRYWCGEETAKWKPDHYVEINLIVSEVSPALSSPSPISMSSPSPISMSSPSPISMSSPSPSSMSSPSPSSMSSPSPSSHNRSVVIIVSGILVMLLLVLVVSLLIVYRWKLNQETAESSAPRVNTDTRINRECCHGDRDYEEIKDRPLLSSSGGETTTIYSTANLPTSPSDSLNYASVNFHKNPSCPNEATAAITKEGTSGDYATVNVSQNPAYSTVNHPHSSSEAPPIYSTLSITRDT